jgi:hypothetical protein
MDRGYMDFVRLYRLHQGVAFSWCVVRNRCHKFSTRLPISYEALSIRFDHGETRRKNSLDWDGLIGMLSMFVAAEPG